MERTGPVFHLIVAENDWSEWQRINPELAGMDYRAWRQEVRDGLSKVQTSGIVTAEVEVKPAAFLAWCRSNKVEVNPDSRAQYASILGVELYAKNESGHG